MPHVCSRISLSCIHLASLLFDSVDFLLVSAAMLALYLACPRDFQQMLPIKSSILRTL